jgi:hypothetical protein
VARNYILGVRGRPTPYIYVETERRLYISICIRKVRIYEYYYHIMWARPDRTVPRSVRTTVKHTTHAPRSPYHLRLYTGEGDGEKASGVA